MSIIKVRMEAFAKGKIREVEIPNDASFMSIENQLELVFHYGQNDFQPKHMPSASVGDVILFEDTEYIIEAVGFKELCKRCTLEYMCYPCHIYSYYKPGEERRHKHSIECERCE